MFSSYKAKRRVKVRIGRVYCIFSIVQGKQTHKSQVARLQLLAVIVSSWLNLLLACIFAFNHSTHSRISIHKQHSNQNKNSPSPVQVQVTGTGGGVSIRHGPHIFIAPSGVQKELLRPEDMFVMEDASREYVRRPQVRTYSYIQRSFQLKPALLSSKNNENKSGKILRTYHNI